MHKKGTSNQVKQCTLTNLATYQFPVGLLTIYAWMLLIYSRNFTSKPFSNSKE